MPVIARHHANDPWRPAQAWPDDCHVQWGGSGLVLRREGGGYGTAFFEAFPAGGGFVRGEGADPPAAEADAFARWREGEDCPGHRWGRKGYANGAGFCRNCGTFRSGAFRPLHDLGAWRRPPSASELSMVADGACAPSPWREGGSDESGRWRRRTWLRARLAGVPVPEPGPGDVSDPRSPYGRACRGAVLGWVRDAWKARGSLSRATADGLEGLFDGVAARGLLRQAVEEGYLPESALAGTAGAAS